MTTLAGYSLTLAARQSKLRKMEADELARFTGRDFLWRLEFVICQGAAERCYLG